MEPANDQLLRDFFCSFPGFAYDRSAAPTSEWRRLQRLQGWPSYRQQENHAARDDARERFRQAMTLTFNTTFGENAEDGTAWDLLCAAAGISDIPENLEKKKKVMLATHVNICDLMEAANKGKMIRVFKSVDALREYTLDEGKVFPKNEAYAGGLLKYLLREITGDYHGRNRAKDYRGHRNRRGGRH